MLGNQVLFIAACAGVRVSVCLPAQYMKNYGLEVDVIWQEYALAVVNPSSDWTDV